MADALLVAARGWPCICRCKLTLKMLCGQPLSKASLLCRVKLRPTQEVTFAVGTVMTHRRYDYLGDFLVHDTEVFALIGL